MNVASGTPSKVWIAIVTIEALTPLLIGTGRGDDLRDTVCVTDANGLPTIPGSSIAGVIRAQWEAGTQGKATHSVFGCNDKDAKDAKRAQGRPPPRDESDSGKRSRLTVGWAAVHDSANIPASPKPRPRGKNDNLDAALAFVARGVTRDHVRINTLGVADGHGKFDVSPVPAGARFSFELRLDDPTDQELRRLREILGSPSLHLGGQTRRGLGGVVVCAIRERAFDWTRGHRDLAAWAAYSGTASLAERAALLGAPAKLTQPKSGDTVWTLDIMAPLGWRIGGGDADATETVTKRTRESTEQTPVDLAPYRERRIVWVKDGTKERAEISKPIAVLPGTSVKGAVRHRTAFHKRRLESRWIDIDGEQRTLAGPDKDHPDGLEGLFGDVKHNDELTDTSFPGRVFIDDVWVPDTTSHTQHHVALDRFSGAPINGALFSEAMLGRTKLRIRVSLRARPQPDDNELASVDALHEALLDIAEGRLALGAASARGHGYFNGTLKRENA